MAVARVDSSVGTLAARMAELTVGLKVDPTAVQTVARSADQLVVQKAV